VQKIKVYAESDFIQLSAVQHYAYCPRQCALIHMDMLWAENQATAEGRLLHAKADSGRTERRGDLKTVTGLLLKSASLGLSGKADVVEFHREDGIWRPFPVEYKRGRSKHSPEDRIQLCLQALCLEEMLRLDVPQGALFYGQSRRREDVFFSLELREESVQMARAAHDLLAQAVLPPPVNDARCPGCSLRAQCLPERSGQSAGRYLEALRMEA
jgi:CRISPR-associated exonuclease Cas4